MVLHSAPNNHILHHTLLTGSMDPLYYYADSAAYIIANSFHSSIILEHIPK